ncbi:MAG: M20 family metallopeptidase [Carbonactinosporaceae bacterium]
MNGQRPAEVPSAAYLEHTAERTARAAVEAAPPTSGYGGAPDQVCASIEATLERRSPALLGLSRALHAEPELGFEERKSVQAVADLLAAEGHDVEVGAYGLPTALRAVAGEATGEGGQRAAVGGPRVALLAEYDALPGIGHACGHNVICATAVGAFLAVADHLDRLGGTVELIGTPAEEGGGGKELIARAGGFVGLDAALMLHPFGGYDIAEHPFLGRRTVDVTYRGVAAHASAAPFMGRNALDAVVAAYQGIAALRQHIPPTDRVHGVITDGGDRPNIVPEHAAAAFYLRSAGVDTLLDLSRRVQAILEGAAAMTGTVCETRWDAEPAYLPIRHNHVLATRYAVRMARRGRTVLPDGVVPEFLTGSTDLGNVSLRLPAIHPMLGLGPSSVALHTADFARWAGSSEADAAVLDGAAGLALTAADFLSDAELRSAARAEFDAAGGPVDVSALLG